MVDRIMLVWIDQEKRLTERDPLPPAFQESEDHVLGTRDNQVDGTAGFPVGGRFKEPRLRRITSRGSVVQHVTLDNLCRCPDVQLAGLAEVGRRGQRQAAFTLVELLVAMTVIAVLAGLLFGGLMMIRQSARLRGALHVLGQLQVGMDSYRAEDSRKRFPPVNGTDSSLSTRPLPGYARGILEIFQERGFIDRSVATYDDQGRILDPWMRPYCYVLQRPECGTAAPPPAVGLLTAPAQTDGSSFPDWNWDRTQTPPRERGWGAHWNPASNSEVTGALLFPYLFSLGKPGATTDGSSWIYLPDGADYQRRTAP